MAAASLLESSFGVKAEVWSVTSFSELARDGMASERAQRLQQEHAQPWITEKLQGSNAPVIAVSDYVRAVPECVRAYVPAPFVTLGTDGFGRSDTRAALRDFFEVDAKWITYTALAELYAGKKSADEMREIASKLGVDLGKAMSTQL